jgi:hypothetical protein
MSKALEAAVKAAHDLLLKEPGPTFHDVSVGKDGIRAIITAFLDAAARDDEVCRLVWVATNFEANEIEEGRAAILELKEAVNAS